MARPIPFIDTRVQVAKTLLDIEELLQVHRVVEISKEYEAGRIKSMTFSVDEATFRMPVKVEAVWQALLNSRRQPVYDQETKERIWAQAERTAWRNVHLWVKAQLALVELGMVTVLEVFMLYILTDSGQTAYERLVEHGIPSITTTVEVLEA